jgi:polar amino acid transport system substrate-binding protein
MSSFKRAVFALVALSGILFTTFAPANAETIMEKLQKGEPIVQAIGNDSPQGYIDKEGKAVGIEVELVKTILTQMGAKNVQQTVTTFGALIPGVQAGRFDIASDGIYIRPERCEAIQFSQPDFAFGIGAFARADAPYKVTTLQQLAQDKSVRFGKLTGGRESDAIVAAGGSADAVQDFTDRPSLIAAVQAKRIDVGLVTRIGAAGAVATNAGLKLLGPLTPPIVNGKPYIFYTALAFNKADQAFVDEFNKRLVAYIHTPAYEKLLAKYNVPADVIPPKNLNLADICSGK